MLQENVIYNDRITVCRAQFCLTSTISLLLMLIVNTTFCPDAWYEHKIRFLCKKKFMLKLNGILQLPGMV